MWWAADFRCRGALAAGLLRHSGLRVLAARAPFLLGLSEVWPECASAQLFRLGGFWRGFKPTGTPLRLLWVAGGAAPLIRRASVGGGLGQWRLGRRRLGQRRIVLGARAWLRGPRAWL